MQTGILCAFQGSFPRGGACVQLLVSGFVAQEIAVSARLLHTFIALEASLAEGESDSAVGIFFAELGNDTAHKVVGESRVLTALHNEGAESELIAVFTAGEYLFTGKAVAFGILVASADTAVKAVVLAVGRYLDKSTEKDLFP